MQSMQQKPFRVAMLGHKRIPSREGGVEIVVGELATRMAKRGYDVTCFNRRGHHVSGAAFDEAILSEYEGVNCKSVWTVNKKGQAAMTASFFAAVKTLRISSMCFLKSSLEFCCSCKSKSSFSSSSITALHSPFICKYSLSEMSPFRL